MTVVPSSGTVGDRLYEQAAPLAYADEANGYALAHVAAAIGAMWQDVYDLVSDSDNGPGWSSLVDIDRVPAIALPWLAQLAGVRLLIGASEAVQRAQVAAADGRNRGTVAAIVAAGQLTLTGMKIVNVTERSGSAYRLTITTRPSETPDPTATLKALMAAKPAGLLLTYSATDFPIIDEGTRTIDASTGNIDTVIRTDVT